MAKQDFIFFWGGTFSQWCPSPIVIDGVTYQPKVLLSEDDFRIEGIKMKNCMAKQFVNGAIHIYMALQTGRKRINLQFKKGNLIQSYAKANTPVPHSLFNGPIEELNTKMRNYPNLEWKREKYDIITK